jgi:hypothetical protein
MGEAFNIVVVGQRGRVGYEALLFAASLREMDPGFSGRLFVAEPQPGPLWTFDPRINDPELKDALTRLDAEILPFTSTDFGEAYAYGNKAECLAALPEGEPFFFFDSDTLITGPVSTLPIDPERPAASMNREGTWPIIELYGPGYNDIWGALYKRFGLDFESSLDTSQPDEFWRRYLYFNAGWFFGPCPVAFGSRLVEVMREIRDNPPEELVCQALFPWLDQIALPLVIHEAGGGRPGPDLDPLDGDASCHWRVMPLLYARENDHVIETLERVSAPNWLKKVLKQHEPFLRMIYQGRGAKVRALFDQDNLPRRERAIRNRIKSNGLWMR